MPELRGVYRHCFRWSRELRVNGETTETLTQLRTAIEDPECPMAMAAFVAAEDRTTTPLLNQEQLAAMRAAALRLIVEDDFDWGPEPLLNACANPGVASLTDESFAAYLLDQFKPDDVPRNAYTSADLYDVALREDAAAFLPPLLHRGERLSRAKEVYTQEYAMISNLALLHALEVDVPDLRASDPWYFRSLGEYDGAFGSLSSFSSSDRAIILEMARQWANQQGYWAADYAWENIAKGNRRLSWRLLETVNPIPERQLREIAGDRDQYWRDRRHAILIWMLRDPDGLVSEQNEVYFADVVGGTQYGWYWGGGLISLFLAPDHGEEEEGGDPEWLLSDLADLFFSPLPSVYPGDALKRIRDYRTQYNAIIRDALAVESEPERQMCFAWFLHRSADPEARELIAVASVSNLTHDDVWENACEARQLLSEYPEEGVEAAIAGFEVGYREKDWQLIGFSADYLIDRDTGFAPSEHPDVMKFMGEQLRDDNVEGNAAVAKRYLRACGESSRPLLNELAESLDDQQSELAIMLLDELDEGAE